MSQKPLLIQGSKKFVFSRLYTETLDNILLLNEINTILRVICVVISTLSMAPNHHNEVTQAEGRNPHTHGYSLCSIILSNLSMCTRREIISLPREKQGSGEFIDI